MKISVVKEELFFIMVGQMIGVIEVGFLILYVIGQWVIMIGVSNFYVKFMLVYYIFDNI